MSFDFEDQQYDNRIEWHQKAMPCHRSKRTRCEENDIVQVFETREGLLAIALGFRNTGFYVGVVLLAGAPIGFGKVLYLTNNTGTVYWARYPIPETDSDRDEDNLDDLQGLQLTDA